MTRLCVPILVDGVDEALRRAARAAEHGADLVELRVDHLVGEPDAVLGLVAEVALPCVLTARHADEGGGFGGDEAERVGLYHAASELARVPAYLDFELARYTALPAMLRQRIDDAATRCGLILSTHDFTGRPADLDRQIAAMAAAESGRVVKAAWRARSLRDNVEAFEVIERRLKPTIALCMGEAGLPSRVLAKKFGALLTFAALDADAGTAPGQPTLDELKRLYRWDRVGRDTRVFGVIGDPVGHSMSPAIHNAGFDALGADGEPFDGVYLPLPIPPAYEHFKATVLSWLDFAPLHFRGASVTIPHKANLLRFVKERGGTIEPLAARIGAANTLTVADEGTLHASNTDYAAALDAVCARLGVDRAGLAGKTVAVLGAGGVARALVAGFAEHGCSVTVLNRTVEKARALADEFGASVAPLSDAAGLDADIWINGTSVGMHPHEDACPVDIVPANWGAGTVVFDTIYNPVRTQLLRRAAEAGCMTVTGVDMFVRQAAAQFEGWTGRSAPTGVMERVVLERLGAEKAQPSDG